MDNILGKDVVKKLLFVTDTIGNNRNNDQTVNETTKLILPTSRAMDQVVKREVIGNLKTNKNYKKNFIKILKF